MLDEHTPKRNILMVSPSLEPSAVDRQKALDIEYHREAAASYDAVVTRNFHFFHVYSLHPWIRRLQTRLAAPEALDVGTGTGVVAVTLAKFGCRVSAIDHSPEMLQHAQVRASGQGVENRIDFKLGDGERLPYPDARFDAVTIQGVLHHLPDYLPMLRESYRVLRPGGELYVSEPCVEGAPMAKVISRALGPARWLKRLVSGSRLAEPAVSDHEEPVSGPKLVNEVRSVGFAVEAEYLVHTGAVRVLPERLKIWVTLLLSWPTRRTRGELIFLVGKKT